MLKIVYRANIPADKNDEFLKVAKELVESSKAEPGNISYSLNKEVKEANRYAMIEIWKDKEAIDAHNTSEHFQRCFAQIKALGVESLSLEVFTEVF